MVVFGANRVSVRGQHFNAVLVRKTLSARDDQLTRKNHLVARGVAGILQFVDDLAGACVEEIANIFVVVNVVIALAVQVIDATLADQRVPSGTAVNVVSASTALDGVVTRTGINLIAQRCASNGVSLIRTPDGNVVGAIGKAGCEQQRGEIRGNAGVHVDAQHLTRITGCFVIEAGNGGCIAGQQCCVKAGNLTVVVDVNGLE